MKKNEKTKEKDSLALGPSLLLCLNLPTELFGIAHVSSEGDAMNLDPFPGLVWFQVEDSWILCGRPP